MPIVDGNDSSNRLLPIERLAEPQQSIIGIIIDDVSGWSFDNLKAQAYKMRRGVAQAVFAFPEVMWDREPARASVDFPTPGMFHRSYFSGQHASPDSVLEIQDRYFLTLRDQFSGLEVTDKPIVCLCYPIFKRPSWVPA